jgi:hypothetical protein
LTQQKKYSKIYWYKNKFSMIKIIFSSITKLLPKITVYFMVFGIAAFGTAMITGTVTSLRDVDSNLGLLKRNKAPGYELVDKKIMDQVLGRKPIKVSAISGEDVQNGVIEGAIDYGIQFISSLIPNCFSFSGFSSCHNLTDGEVQKATKAANKETLAPETAKALNTTLSGHFNNIVSSITRKVTGKLMSALTKDIMVLLKDSFSVFDKYVKILEGLADSYSGTRIAIGYLIYRDIEGVNGKGSSLFLSSDQFTESMLSVSGIRNDFPDKNYLLRIITDGVAWLDFMNVQRYSQYDIIGNNKGFLDKNTRSTVQQVNDGINAFTEQNFFTLMEDSIDRAILGINCQNSNNLFKVPILGDFAKSGLGNPCRLEGAQVVKQALKIRQDQIRSAVERKINQYQLVSPTDCKARGYFNVVYPDREDPANPGHNISKEKYDIGYEPTKPGILGRLLAISASQIERIEISPSECETFKTIQSRQQDFVAKLTADSNNLKDVGANNPISTTNRIIGGLGTALKIPSISLVRDAVGQEEDKGIFQNFIGGVLKNFNDYSKPLFAQFDRRFKTLLEAGEKVLNGGATGQKLRDSIDLIKNQIGAQVRSNLDSLNENYKKYREAITNTKESNLLSVNAAGEAIVNATGI